MELVHNCSLCKHIKIYDGCFKCKFLDSSIYTMPQEPYGVYECCADEMVCIEFEPKDKE